VIQRICSCVVAVVTFPLALGWGQPVVRVLGPVRAETAVSSNPIWQPDLEYVPANSLWKPSCEKTAAESDPAVIVSRANDQAPEAFITAMAASASICRARFQPSLNASLGGLAQSDAVLDAVSTAASTRELPQGQILFQEKRGIHWASLIGEELLYISVKNAYRMSQSKTRDSLGGPFFNDWGYILQHIDVDQWSDGGKWFTNDVGHPLDGSIAAFIYRRNDDNTRNLKFDLHDREYRKGILKAFLVAAVVSTESEIGPLSEATVGHVGLKSDWWLRLPDGQLEGPIPQDLIGLQALTQRPWWVRGNNGTGMTDFVMTPFGGAAVMLGEDALDKYVIERLERHVHNRYLVATMRCFMNPTRSAANFFSFTAPWHRDSRPLTTTAKN
jgi:hypothetical protein